MEKEESFVELKAKYDFCKEMRVLLQERRTRIVNAGARKQNTVFESIWRKREAEYSAKLFNFFK